MTQIEREQLIDEYRESLRLVRLAYQRAQRRLESGDEKAVTDCEHLASMERDLLWTLQYLETGEMPDYHRGIYKWTVPVDPNVLRRIVRAKTLEESESRWIALDRTFHDLLTILAPREREAFIMVRARGVPFRLAAEYMGIRSPGAVFNMVRRAERKLRRALIGYESASFTRRVVVRIAH